MNNWLTGKNRLRGSKDASSDFSRHILKRLRELYTEETLSNLHILDFGCGDALISEKISQNVAEMKICDISDAYLSMEKMERFGFCFVHDLLKNHPREKFDVIYSFGVIQYLTITDYENIMNNLNYLLKPGGYIIHFNILNKHKIFNYYQRPNSLENILKFIVGGGMRSYLTDRIWNDGSRWHDIRLLQNASKLDSIDFPGYSKERTDLIYEKK